MQASLSASISIDGGGELETSSGEGTVGGPVTLLGFGAKFGGAGTLDVTGTVNDQENGLTIVGPAPGTVFLAQPTT